MAALRLDVLIPTHNRGALLESCLRSVMAAAPAPGLDVHVTVIENGCSDDTADRIRRQQAAFPRRITLLSERRRGKSRALNAGIASTSGDLVAMIDDDEQVDREWLRVIADAFTGQNLDFIGGPYMPVWGAPPPEWLPEDYRAVLGDVDNGAKVRAYDRDFPGILKGGNAVIRRRALQKVGPFAEHLGPGSFAQLFSCEDEDMYLRLLESGAIGHYLPNLVIYHYISAARLTREYYRSWCFWRGVSRGLMDRRHPLPVKYLAGVPRFLWGQAARASLRLALPSSRRAPRELFGDELRIWDVAGYFYGRHVYTLARFSPLKSRRRTDTSGGRATTGGLARGNDVELAG